jgi:predicted ATP-dependent endonuclease of OLD family
MSTDSTNAHERLRNGRPIEEEQVQGLPAVRAAAEEGRTIVLVEGISDKVAIAALAARRGHDLDLKGVKIVAIGGATKIRAFLELLGPVGLNVKLAGLCDVGEERHFRKALARAGFGSNLTRSAMEQLGFYVCEADLEDELIRALGVDAVLEVITAQGDLGRFRIFQRQPEWEERSNAAQLRRWLGTTAHRKISYAELLVNALELDRAPPPLERLLARVAIADSR